MRWLLIVALCLSAYGQNMNGISANSGTVGISGKTDTLQWTASTGATYYNVYRSLTSGTYTTPPLATGVTVTHFADWTAHPGTTYFYVVDACNSVGCSGHSSEVTAVVP